LSVPPARSTWGSVFRGQVVVWPASLAGLLVVVTSLLVGRNRGDVRVDVAMAGMAAFLFGVLLAFTIVRTRERLALVQDLVAKGADDHVIPQGVDHVIPHPVLCLMV